MKKATIIIFLVIVLSFVASFYFSPQMPERVASHWNAGGEVDGYIPKIWGLFLMPVLSLVLALLFLFIPKIDPLKENVQKFRKYFDGFIVLTMLFLFYLHLLTIYWNLGGRFNMVYTMVPAFSVLFYYIGVMTGHAKRNWFIGIRTPWTMSSEMVWDKTHQLGGKLFKISALVALAGIFFGQYAIFFMVGPALLTAACTFIYSYLEYKKEKPTV